MLLKLKADNGLPRRSINGVVFYTQKPTEVSDDFDYSVFKMYLEQTSYEKYDQTAMKEEETLEPVEKIVEDKTKAELVEEILSKYPNEYTKTDLNKLKKEVLIMTLKGELE